MTDRPVLLCLTYDQVQALVQAMHGLRLVPPNSGDDDDDA
jgi:hypothetical protein